MSNAQAKSIAPFLAIRILTPSHQSRTALVTFFIGVGMGLFYTILAVSFIGAIGLGVYTFDQCKSSVAGIDEKAKELWLRLSVLLQGIWLVNVLLVGNKFHESFFEIQTYVTVFFLATPVVIVRVMNWLLKSTCWPKQLFLVAVLLQLAVAFPIEEVSPYYNCCTKESVWSVLGAIFFLSFMYILQNPSLFEKGMMKWADNINMPETVSDITIDDVIAKIENTHGSFVRATGEFYIDTTREIALHPESPDEIKQEWALLKKFLCAEDSGLVGEAKTKAGVAWQSYMALGIAPSENLENSFQMSRKKAKEEGWQIIPIPDEIKRVFDGMLAAPSASEAAQNKSG